MAKSIDNVMTYGASGLLGNVVFRRVGNKVFICKRPTPSDKPPTAEQLECREHFRKAQRYAADAIRTPHLKAYYETGKGSAYHAALRDARKAPEIKDIRPGPVIRIKARDNFRVQAVWVVILQPSGALWEEGHAVNTNTFEWEYKVKKTPPTDMILHVSATDLPGNVTRQEVTLSVALFTNPQEDSHNIPPRPWEHSLRLGTFPSKILSLFCWAHMAFYVTWLLTSNST